MKYKKEYFFYKHHKRFSKHFYCRLSSISKVLFLFTPTIIILLHLCCIPLVAGGCREQEHDVCETVCKWNATIKQNTCYLRAAVILPSNTNVEASLPRVNISFLFTTIQSIWVYRKYSISYH